MLKNFVFDIRSDAKSIGCKVALMVEAPDYGTALGVIADVLDPVCTFEINGIFSQQVKREGI